MILTPGTYMANAYTLYGKRDFADVIKNIEVGYPAGSNLQLQARL